jgi:hypothetical protein
MEDKKMVLKTPNTPKLPCELRLPLDNIAWQVLSSNQGEWVKYGRFELSWRSIYNRSKHNNYLSQLEKREVLLRKKLLTEEQSGEQSIESQAIVIFSYKPSTLEWVQWHNAFQSFKTEYSSSNSVHVAIGGSTEFTELLSELEKSCKSAVRARKKELAAARDAELEALAKQKGVTVGELKKQIIEDKKNRAELAKAQRTVKRAAKFIKVNERLQQLDNLLNRLNNKIKTEPQSIRLPESQIGFDKKIDACISAISRMLNERKS